MKTQKERIIQHLKKCGWVSNVWAVNNYILRLSERIRELERIGMRFKKASGHELGKPKHMKKYYFYILQ
jgi:hypothetical protein